MLLRHGLAGLAYPAASSYVAPVAQSTAQTGTTAANAITFTDAAIGTADANRKVIVQICARIQNTTSVTGVTIGGVSATVHRNEKYQSAGTVVIVSVIASLDVSSGTTATVVLQTSGNTNWGYLVPYRAVNAQVVTATGTTDDVDGTPRTLILDMNTNAGDTVLYNGIGQPSSGVLSLISGYTSDDVFLTTGRAASNTNVGAGTPLSIRPTINLSTDYVTASACVVRAAS